MVDRVQWAPATFAQELARADLGLMPLRDDEWSRGKCAYKLLQYGAAALPLVGSPVGANREVLSRAEGLAPRSVDDWYDAMVQLLEESDESRARRGRAARRAVEENYSFRSWEPTWVEAVGLAAAA